jgi:geranyl-CoA carboxylase alpha subunit
MGEAAVRLAKAVHYANAGTVEYLLDAQGNFYFLEMNTRIQVEHPVTEEVTDTNLIRMQFDAAMGKPLALKQNDVRITRHAIEARLCAEDPADGYKPQLGTGFFNDTSGAVRVDGPTDSESAYITVSPHYDSMIAKIIGHGPNRAAALAALRKALGDITFNGVRTNRNLLIDILDDADFREARLDIGWLTRRPPFVDRHIDELPGKAAALLLATRDGNPWRSTGAARTIVKLRERNVDRTFVVEGSSLDTLTIAKTYAQDHDIWAEITDGETKAHTSAFVQGALIHVSYDDGAPDALFEDITYAPAEPKGAAGANIIRAPMAGRIVKVLAEPGQRVAKNQILVILEAMKMEHELRAAADGTIETVTAKQGDQVAIRQTLVTLTA